MINVELRHRYARSRARAHRDLIADGPKESVTDITMDKAIGISRPTFYRMKAGGGDAELRDRYAQARAMQADRVPCVAGCE